MREYAKKEPNKESKKKTRPVKGKIQLVEEPQRHMDAELMKGKLSNQT